MTQREFCAFVGMKFEAYSKAVRGETGLSRDTAYLIEYATGARADSIDRKQTKPPVAVFGDPYSRSSFEQWREQGIEAGSDPAKSARIIYEWAYFLFWVAKREKKLSQVSEFLTESLNRARRQFGLIKATDRQLARITNEQNFPFRVGELRRNQAWAKAMRYEHKEYREGRVVTDEEIVSLKQRTNPLWVPGFAFPGFKVVEEKLLTK